MKPNDNETQLPFIELERVGKVYNRVTVLEEISLGIAPGLVKAIIGRNGSGKSTMLSILAGIIQISSGQLLRRDKGMKIGYSPEFFPGLKFTPAEFLQSVGRLHNLAPKEINLRITELLDCFRLESFRTRPMESFSKGMLQKVNLMQSLLIRPSLLLLDEPMSGLDSPAQDALLEILQEMKQEGTSIVFSAHEPQWIQVLADEVHVLQAGRMIQTIHRTQLHSSSHSKIVYNGVTPNKNKQLEEMPGFITITSAQEQQGFNCSAIYVDPSHSDAFLRNILESGGSVISVERIGGLSGLELWMTPKDTSKRGVES